MEISKEETIEYLKKIGSEYQKPIQYQILALEEILKFQKNKMLKELWEPYITAVENFLLKQFNELFEELKND